MNLNYRERKKIKINYDKILHRYEVTFNSLKNIAHLHILNNTHKGRNNFKML